MKFIRGFIYLMLILSSVCYLAIVDFQREHDRDWISSKRPVPGCLALKNKINAPYALLVWPVPDSALLAVILYNSF